MSCAVYSATVTNVKNVKPALNTRPSPVFGEWLPACVNVDQESHAEWM